MAHLVPVDEIIEVLLHGEGSRQVAQLSNLKKNYNDTLKLIELDVEKAKQLLDEAGWVDTDDNNIRDKMVNGEKLQLFDDTHNLVQFLGWLFLIAPRLQIHCLFIGQVHVK